MNCKFHSITRNLKVEIIRAPLRMAVKNCNVGCAFVVNPQRFCQLIMGANIGYFNVVPRSIKSICLIWIPKPVCRECCIVHHAVIPMSTRIIRVSVEGIMSYYSLRK